MPNNSLFEMELESHDLNSHPSTDDFDSSELEAKVAPLRKLAKVELRVVA